MLLALLDFANGKECAKNIRLVAQNNKPFVAKGLLSIRICVNQRFRYMVSAVLFQIVEPMLQMVYPLNCQALLPR